MLGQYMIGRAPFQINYFTVMAHDDYAQRRSSLEFFCAL